VVATASWEQGEDLQDVRCLQGMVGIQTQANGPFPGLRVRWDLKGEQTAARNDKLLRPKPGEEQKLFRGTGGGGEITNQDGQSDLHLEPAVERNPGQGSELSGVVRVFASLDKDEVPDALKAFLGNKTFLIDYLKGRATNWAKFLFDALLDISLKAIKKAFMPTHRLDIKVTYHGKDVYIIKGTLNIAALLITAQMDVYAYSCEGLNGNWKGELDARSQATDPAHTIGNLFGMPVGDDQVGGQFQGFVDLRDGRPGTINLLETLDMRLQVDPSMIERGQYGTVGTAEFLIDGLPMALLLLGSSDLPIRRLNESNAEHIDEVCPGSESYFP
jgi:hypothetical protein